ncbi:MAG: four helix bundle protein [Bacteroidetes bacterium]|nr:four helix bundle protein [Bacteroidota bacterium]
MKSNNLIQEKSFRFAVKSVYAYKELINVKREYVLSKQFLRSSTSIAANIEEALGAQSSKDFLSKISISYKETRESLFWIKLLMETSYLDKNLSEELRNDARELLRIIGSIQLTMKKKIKQNS